jgi:hypothetical protein
MSNVGHPLPGPKIIGEIAKPPFVLLALGLDRRVQKTGCRRAGVKPFLSGD